VDSLVIAAGLTDRGTLLDTTPELFDARIAVNLKGPFFLMQAVVAGRVARQALASSSASAARRRTPASPTWPRTSRPRPGWPG
jgi:NAD(P)-dependent dehydrogenase (short-subunit alcohol dehydrogenase family)